MTILSPPKMTAEQEIMLLCCRHQLTVPAAARLRHLQAGAVDWHHVVLLADAHDVWPFFTSRLAAVDLPLQAPVAQRFQQRLLENTAVNITLTKQLGTVLQILDAHGIPALAFKGPTLAAAAYGHVGLRRFGDLDILVAPQTARNARDCMLAHGFALSEIDHNILDGVLPRAGSEYSFWPQQAGWAAVEIQSRPWKWPMALRLDTSALIARRLDVQVAGMSIPTLAPEDLILVLAVHGLHHWWELLRYVCDVDAAASMKLDWATVVDRACAARAGRILAIALLLAHAVLDTDSGPALEWARDDRVAAKLTPTIARRLFAPPHRHLRHLWKDWLHLRSRERLSDKLRFCVRTLTLERIVRPLDRIKHPRPRRRRTRAGARG